MCQADQLAQHHSGLLTTVGFKRFLSSPVAVNYPERDLVGVVHGNDFVFVGVDKELVFVLCARHYELKDRGRLGSGKKEVDCWAGRSGGMNGVLLGTPQKNGD